MSTAPRLQFENYVEKQPEIHPVPVYQPQGWFQPPAKKPPRPVGEDRVSWERAKREATLDYVTKVLDATYVIEDRKTVVAFILEHRLNGLLRQASQPLRAKFGDRQVKTLSIVSDDEGFETLFCTITTSGDLQQNREALNSFDREWWLFHVQQAAGRLNFDFKLI